MSWFPHKGFIIYFTLSQLVNKKQMALRKDYLFLATKEKKKK